MKKTLLACMCLLCSGRAFAADPYVGFIYPAGVEAGTTNRLLVGGQGFWGLMEAGVTGEGVEILKVERMPTSAPPTDSQKKWLKTWLDGLIEKGDAARPAFPTNAAQRFSEWTVNAWWMTLDQLDRKALEAVERDIYMFKNPLQMTPSLRQVLFVDVAVSPRAKPGKRALAVWTTAGISPPRPFYVTKAAHVEEPAYVPPHRKAPKRPPPVAHFPTVLDGRILPGETDRFQVRLAPGRPYRFSTLARELQPFVGDAVPGFFNATLRLLDPAGREVAFSDDCDRFKPDPAFSYAAPTGGVHTLEIRDNLFRGRADFVYAVTVEEEASPKPPAATRANPDLSATLHEGGSVTGFVMPKAEVTHPVALEGPGTFVFDLLARRQGSPLDGVLTLRDAQGRLVWREDDVTNTLFVGTVAQGECDARGKITLEKGEKGRYTVTVSDVTGHGGSNYVYRLSLRRDVPDFAVYASRSAFLGRFGQRVPFDLHVVRTGGFTGPVTLLEDAFCRYENAYVPAFSNGVSAVFVSKRRQAADLRAFRMRAFAEPGGKPKVVEVMPADACMQAFAWQHLVPAATFIEKDLWPWPGAVRNLKAADTLVLAGPATADTNFVNLVRLYFDLRHPKRNPEILALPEIPAKPWKKSWRILALTPWPYDQYAPRKAPNEGLNATAVAGMADRVRRQALAEELACCDLHEALTTTLRERVTWALCGEDRRTPSEELRLLALGRLLETMRESGEVATVKINAANGKQDVFNARINRLKASPSAVSFTYEPRALPLPETAAYRNVQGIYPVTAKFNRETLQISNLKPGTYALTFDGRDMGSFAASAFLKGVNVALLDTPSQRQAKAAWAALGTPGYALPKAPAAHVAVVRKGP